MTDADKIARYNQIGSLVEEHFSLMKSQQKRSADFSDIEFAKVNVYRAIAEIVTGVDPL